MRPSPGCTIFRIRMHRLVLRAHCAIESPIADPKVVNTDGTTAATIPRRRQDPSDRAVQMASPGGLVVLAWPFPLREPLGFSEGRKTRAPTGTWCKQPSQTACL